MLLWCQQHGETLHNIEGRIGGDADLSDNGREFGSNLAKYIKEQNISKVKYQEGLVTFFSWVFCKNITVLK